jgi:hypothetical protein
VFFSSLLVQSASGWLDWRFTFMVFGAIGQSVDAGVSFLAAVSG